MNAADLAALNAAACNAFRLFFNAQRVRNPKPHLVEKHKAAWQAASIALRKAEGIEVHVDSDSMGATVRLRHGERVCTRRFDTADLARAAARNILGLSFDNAAATLAA